MYLIIGLIYSYDFKELLGYLIKDNLNKNTYMDLIDARNNKFKNAVYNEKKYKLVGIGCNLDKLPKFVSGYFYTENNIIPLNKYKELIKKLNNDEKIGCIKGNIKYLKELIEEYKRLVTIIKYKYPKCKIPNINIEKLSISKSELKKYEEFVEIKMHNERIEYIKENKKAINIEGTKESIEYKEIDNKMILCRELYKKMKEIDAVSDKNSIYNNPKIDDAGFIETGRLNYCRYYSPIAYLDTKKYKVGDIINLKRKGITKRYTITKIDNENNIMMLDDKLYVGDLESMKESYNCLHHINKLQCQGWWNRKFEIM